MVVLKRTLDIGINGYPSPTIPKGPRSIRRRALRPKALQSGQICPFELLATVAGKLLEVSECSSASSSAAVGFDQRKICRDATKKEPLDVNKPFGGEHDDQGSSEGSVFSSGLQRDICKGKLETAGNVSPFTSSGCSDKVNSDPKSTTPKSHVEFVKLSSIVERDSPKCGEYNNTNVDNKANRQEVDINKSPAVTNFEEKVELSLFRDSNPNASFLKQGGDVNLGCKDDDEIHSRYSLHNNNNTEKASRSPTHPGDARIRKFLSPKYWKTAPKPKDYEDSNTGGGVKHSYLNKRPCYDIDRSQRDTPFKKRKLFDRSSVVTQDGGFSCESVSNSPLKSIDDEKNGSAGKLREGNRTSSSNFVSQKSCNLRNSNVRLSIKSFKVPELFIEVPETTTVGSLKRTVSEAVTTILCGGLRVGVLLQGKKTRDDSRTLLQTGISRNEDINTIEFMLEQDTAAQTPPPPPPICRKDPPPATLSCDTPKFVNRCQINPKDDMFRFETRSKPTTTDSNSPSGSYGDLVPSPSSEMKDRKNCSDSKALVPVLGASMDALAVMPVNQRPKRSEMGQRRTRRPFSVSEVEALVHAVEKLGTGRWRDVKLCAFDNAKHRTYVDLKDKWKTLVHTARISPQQRRGEPVPQDLLDRVLAAQAYWSDHQAKQHGKQQHQAVIPKLFHSATQKS